MTYGEFNEEPSRITQLHVRQHGRGACEETVACVDPFGMGTYLLQWIASKRVAARVPNNYLRSVLFDIVRENNL